METRTHFTQRSKITHTTNSMIRDNMNKSIAFSISNVYNHETHVGTFIPIMNLESTKAIAYIAAYFDADYLDSILMQNDYVEILYIAIVFLLFFFSLYITLNNEKLQKMAHYDKLTSLSNRAHFYIELDKEIKRTKRANTKLAIMFIDLDGFKAVNDTYGHDAGDQLLVDVSRRLLNCVRDVDIVARLGGDEFTVALANIKDEKSALFVANKIIDKLSESFVIGKNVIHIGASIGISIYPDNAKDSDEIIKQADNAMYFAKENGKNRAIIHKETNT